MNLRGFINEYGATLLTIITGLSVIIEIVPIRVNPWTWILKHIGNKMNSDLLKQIAVIENQLHDQNEKIDNNEKDRIRYEILEFANSCRNHQLHTKEEFDHVLEQYDKYEIIMAKLNKPNGKVTQAMKYINTLYIERQKQNDFL